jgi:hypothetical protein
VTSRAEAAVAKADSAIEAISGPIGADAAKHGWTDQNRRLALRHLEQWRNDLQADGVVHPDHAFGWLRWLLEQNLPGSSTTDQTDAWVELIRDLDLYVSRMFS